MKPINVCVFIVHCTILIMMYDDVLCCYYNVRMKNCNFKIKFSRLSRTTKKSECISVNGPKLWNDLSADIILCKSIFTFKKCTKLYFCNHINLFNAFV